MDDEEDGEKGEESGDERKDTELFGAAGVIAKFTKSWGWIHSAIKVREILGYTIDQVYDLNVIEFLNYMAYIKSYNAMADAIQKEHDNKGKRYY